MKKTLKGIGIFILGVVATIILTKTGDKIYPNDSDVTIDKVNDTILVVDVTKSVMTEQIEIDKSELKKEVEYWKNVANKSNKNYKNLENRISDLEITKLTKTYDPVSENLKDVSNSDIEIIKNEIKELKEIKTAQLQFVSDKGLNKVITNIKSIFPNKNGYSHSGPTGLLVLDCPKFDNNDDYIDVGFVIKDKELLNKIAVVFAYMTRIDEKGNHYQVYENHYKPQFGFNHLKVRNVKSKNNSKFSFHYGVFLKSEVNKESPRAEGMNCYFRK